MVVRVYGSANGLDIVFSPLGDDRWNCVVPKLPGGEYVVDLYAEDEAGNIGYAATALFIVDAKHLLVDVKWLHVAENLSTHIQNFKMEVPRCEKCGGDMFELLDS